MINDKFDIQVCNSDEEFILEAGLSARQVSLMVADLLTNGAIITGFQAARDKFHLRPDQLEIFISKHRGTKRPQTVEQALK